MNRESSSACTVINIQTVKYIVYAFYGISRWATTPIMWRMCYYCGHFQSNIYIYIYLQCYCSAAWLWRTESPLCVPYTVHLNAIHPLCTLLLFYILFQNVFKCNKYSDKSFSASACVYVAWLYKFMHILGTQIDRHALSTGTESKDIKKYATERFCLSGWIASLCVASIEKLLSNTHTHTIYTCV